MLNMDSSSHAVSPFFHPGASADNENLGLLHLKRDQLVPVILQDVAQNTDGYAEGVVTNTRFGSFPHSTLLGVPWGSQVLASKVDTGSRGRKAKKRKREDGEGNAAQDDEDQGAKAAIAAGTGFAHLMFPTPESWTISLPHRTQVVYTPDSSYILQRLRVIPGQTIIEAGAGSGSFTHAAARAVFSGYSPNLQDDEAQSGKQSSRGRVCSFEYHEPRVADLRKELQGHGLSDIVNVTHRDVYERGFSLDGSGTDTPNANAVFLDLPAPWLALRHLTRRRITSQTYKRVTNPLAAEADSMARAAQSGGATSTEAASVSSSDAMVADGTEDNFVSPLDPGTPTRLCTFSPCIEQVQSTVAALRQLGWTEIEMVEVQQRRIDVRRERTGLQEEGLRGVQASAANVEEAVERLMEVEGRLKDWHQKSKVESARQDKAKAEQQNSHAGTSMRQERLDRIKTEARSRKLYKEGQLVHRTEPDIKSHTSYLVFAVLPREWTGEDEAECVQRWGDGPVLKDESPNGTGAKAGRGGKKKAARPVQHEIAQTS